MKINQHKGKQEKENGDRISFPDEQQCQRADKETLGSL